MLGYIQVEEPENMIPVPLEPAAPPPTTTMVSFLSVLLTDMVAEVQVIRRRIFTVGSLRITRGTRLLSVQAKRRCIVWETWEALDSSTRAQDRSRPAFAPAALIPSILLPVLISTRNAQLKADGYGLIKLVIMMILTEMEIEEGNRKIK